MKILKRVIGATALILLGWGSAHAAPVTIDFSGINEFAGLGDSFQEPNGYEFTTTEGWLVCTGPGCWIGGQALYLLGPSKVAMARADGQLFDLLSMDAFLDDADLESCSFNAHACYGENAIISAWDTQNNLIAQRIVHWSDPTTVIFDSTWKNIAKMTYEDQECFIEACEGAIDNIQVNVVPIPAAAWLFGSALAGLGGLRRRRSAQTRKQKSICN